MPHWVTQQWHFSLKLKSLCGCTAGDSVHNYWVVSECSSTCERPYGITMFRTSRQLFDVHALPSDVTQTPEHHSSPLRHVKMRLLPKNEKTLSLFLQVTACALLNNRFYNPRPSKPKGMYCAWNIALWCTHRQNTNTETTFCPIETRENEISP